MRETGLLIGGPGKKFSQQERILKGSLEDGLKAAERERRGRDQKSVKLIRERVDTQIEDGEIQGN